MDGPKEAAHRLTVTTPEEARAAVAALKAKGVDFLKVHTKLPPAAFFALLEEAKKQGLPVAAHLPHGVALAEASDAGVASLEHIEMLVESVRMRREAPAKAFDDAVAEYDGEKGAVIFARLAKNGTAFVPTLVAYERGFVLWGSDPKKVAIRREAFRKLMELARRMHEAGVTMLAGSDFSDWALVPGIDLHNELGLLVQAGFTPMEAIQAATSAPTRFLGRAADLGTIEPGKLADLVLLDADPLEDISHTRKIHAVVLGGRLFEVARLREEALQRTAR
jgi:imidazolonepropionase-like amidohydrolase